MTNVYLKHEVLGVCLVHHVAGVPLGSDADPVVLVGEVLDALEVEGLDDTLGAQEVLGAARRSLNSGQRLAVDLGDPEAELVGFAGKKNRFAGDFISLFLCT